MYENTVSISTKYEKAVTVDVWKESATFFLDGRSTEITLNYINESKKFLKKHYFLHPQHPTKSKWYNRANVWKHIDETNIVITMYNFF
jgi:hypothetical protein